MSTTCNIHINIRKEYRLVKYKLSQKVRLTVH